MSKPDIIVVGASAGGIEPLTDIVAWLPADLAATVLVVVHLPADDETRLPEILSRGAELRVTLAEDGEPLRPGAILLAPPGRHLEINDDAATLSCGPRENGFRPAIDVLFRSAAVAGGARVIGVILSGALDDGAAGMVAVRLRGGVGIAQDPDEALHPSMPQAAIDAAIVDHVVPAGKIADLVLELIGSRAPLPASGPVSELMATEVSMVAPGATPADLAGHPGVPSAFVCPDCSGPLYEIDEGRLTRYRCRVGHAWSPLSLAKQHSRVAENALWTAAETLEEKAALRERLARRAREDGRDAAAEHLQRTAAAARKDAGRIRHIIEDAASGSDAHPQDH
jgi:two-component system, chemotaxis family, protein-glutamate methylesterase/glutaminase